MFVAARVDYSRRGGDSASVKKSADGAGRGAGMSGARLEWVWMKAIAARSRGDSCATRLIGREWEERKFRVRGRPEAF